MPYYVSFSTVQPLAQQAVTLPARLVRRTGGTAQYRTRDTPRQILGQGAQPRQRHQAVPVSGHLNILNRYDTQA